MDNDTLRNRIEDQIARHETQLRDVSAHMDNLQAQLDQCQAESWALQGAIASLRDIIRPVADDEDDTEHVQAA